MMSLTEYLADTGKITRMVSATSEENLNLNKRDGFSYISGESFGTIQYVNNNVIVSRPTFDVKTNKTTIKADGIDEIVFSDLPSGENKISLYVAVNDSWIENNSSFSLTVNMPGQYRMLIQQWPYQDVEVTFNAS
jgi:hypothetical protein